jgi:cytochrome c-type biogenesis protein CcmH/NrfF
MIERKKFWIIRCPRCQAYQIVDSRNKSKTCSQCARRFEIVDLPKLDSARDAREARIIVAKLKMPVAVAAEPKVI